MKTLILFLWSQIKKVVHFIGRINTFLILSIFYFVILAPAKIWIAAKRFSKGKAENRTSFWIKREGKISPESAKFQF